MQNEQKTQEKILDMFDECLKTSDSIIKNNNEIKLSQKVTGPLDSFVEEVLNMSDEQAKEYKANDTYVSIMSDTPSVILNNVKDAENLEVIMRFDSFYLETRESGVLDGNYHNLGTQTKELPNYISNPDAIIRNSNGRLNLISVIGKNKTGLFLLS